MKTGSSKGWRKILNKGIQILDPGHVFIPVIQLYMMSPAASWYQWWSFQDHILCTGTKTCEERNFFLIIPREILKMILSDLSFFFNFLFGIRVQLINNVVIISDEQRRDSAIYIHVSILLQTPLPSSLPQNIEKSPMCYTVGPCWLSILNIANSISNSLIIPSSNLPPGNHKFILYVCEFVSVLSIPLYHFFLDSTYKGCHMIFPILWLTSLSVILSRSIHASAHF